MRFHFPLNSVMVELQKPQANKTETVWKMNIDNNNKDAKVELGLGPGLHQFFCPGSEI